MKKILKNVLGVVVAFIVIGIFIQIRDRLCDGSRK